MSRQGRASRQHTLIWTEMPGLARTSFRLCWYADEADARSTFDLFRMSGLRKENTSWLLLPLQTSPLPERGVRASSTIPLV